MIEFLNKSEKMSTAPIGSPISFDTSLLKCFCKSTPEAAIKSVQKEKLKDLFSTKNYETMLNDKFRKSLLIEDPSLDNISTEMIKNLTNDIKNPEKFDSSLLIMNLNEKEIYNDFTEIDQKKLKTVTSVPNPKTALSTNVTSPYVTPKIHESFKKKRLFFF